jgi:hypothetical protein
MQHYCCQDAGYFDEQIFINEKPVGKRFPTGFSFINERAMFQNTLAAQSYLHFE